MHSFGNNQEELELPCSHKSATLLEWLRHDGPCAMDRYLLFMSDHQRWGVKIMVWRSSLRAGSFSMGQTMDQWRVWGSGSEERLVRGKLWLGVCYRSGWGCGQGLKYLKGMSVSQTVILMLEEWEVGHKQSSEFLESVRNNLLKQGPDGPIRYQEFHTAGYAVHWKKPVWWCGKRQQP